MFAATLVVLGIGIFWYINKQWKKDWIAPNEPFPAAWRIILAQEINFYNALNPEERKRFEYKVQEFLLNCRITGIQTEVDDTDRLLVASSAVIPIFEFPKWHYINLFEVLLYPSSFDENFNTTGPDRRILGMVGTGFMDGKMILSKRALHQGFDNTSDKRNTAIHEFVHLIDKMDGSIDGVPSLLLERPYVIPWLDLIQKKIDDIYENNSDINPYGGTNKAEFFAVISEYFFERPKLLAHKHPELYEMLEDIFDQDMDERILLKERQSLGRNSPCPCGSEKKFKKCCGRVHYT